MKSDIRHLLTTSEATRYLGIGTRKLWVLGNQGAEPWPDRFSQGHKKGRTRRPSQLTHHQVIMLPR